MQSTESATCAYDVAKNEEMGSYLNITLPLVHQ